MDTDDYAPRVLDDDFPSVVPPKTDSSKWAAVHGTLDATMSQRGGPSGTGSLFTVAWVLGLLLGLLWILRNGRAVFSQWQENVQRRANRRRHGIPDEDDRPFNVAYAAAALARKERERKEKEKLKPRVQPAQPRLEWERHGEALRLRQRPLLTCGAGQPLSAQQFVQGSSTAPVNNRNSGSMPGEAAPQWTQKRSQATLEPRHGWSDRYNPDVPVQASSARPPYVDVRRGHPDPDGSEHGSPERRKHHQDDTDDEDRTTKRTRVAGEELIDGDNDAAWAGASRRSSLQVPKRGSKRQANPEADDEWEMSQDKRARKGSGVYIEEESDAGVSDVDMARESSDVEPEPSRGTKREREDRDSPQYDTDDSHKFRPIRKRRAEGEANADELQTRGRKRDRSRERHERSDDEAEGPGQKPARHKRGRKQREAREDAEMAAVDASESDDLPEIAHDPACGGRRIGEIWEVNGRSFKVGLDGRRLRHALIRQRRNKFPMPKDSAHTDAQTNVDVIVEKWLNDDEYAAAKENHELAWQDPTPNGTPIKAEALKQDEPPVSGGKRLLWDGPPPSPNKGRASLRSASSVQNPFDLAPSNAGRRVASAHLLMNNPAESPKLRNAKSFSKWEKQDLEASSLKKMRAKMEKEKKEKEKEHQSVAKPGISFAPTTTPLAPTTNIQSQPPALAPPASEFKPTPTSAPAPIAAPALSNIFAKPSSTPSTAPNSFGNPAAPASGGIPNFFAKPANTPPTTTSGPSTQPFAPSPFAAAQSSSLSAAPLAVPAPQTSAKPSFSFAPAPSSGSTPTETSTSTTAKPSFNFGPAPAAAPSSTPAASNTAKPSFSFGPPAAQPAKSDAPKALTFGFTQPAANTTSPTEPAKGAAPANPFFKPGSDPFSKPASDPFAKPASNPFGKPATQPTSAPSPANNSAFPFNAPSQPSQPAAQKPPTFQFGVPTNVQSNSASPGAGSLMDRLAPASTAQSTSSQIAPSPFGSNNNSSKPAFATADYNPFGDNSSKSIFKNTQPGPPQGFISESANKPSPFTPSGAPKSVFGQPFSFGKPSDTSDASKPAAPSPLSFGKLSGQPETSTTQSKPAFAFNFGSAGTTNAPAASPAAGARPFQAPQVSSAGAAAPPNFFGFGNTPSSNTPPPSAFGSLFGKPTEGEKKT
ncbi:hypothetical protein K439DRAFT_1656119 [Ramaria rubella]|nr:hypothetical protein K439DRAFT_1656119 [Ramaria rubella]